MERHASQQFNGHSNHMHKSFPWHGVANRRHVAALPIRSRRIWEPEISFAKTMHASDENSIADIEASRLLPSLKPRFPAPNFTS